ncbi:MAG: glycosyltransferase family 4 protein [Treponema sp.]
MKIAIDCRMSGQSGIGTFLDGILPFLLQSGSEFLLLGYNPRNPQSEEAQAVFSTQNAEFVPCAVKTFSLKETFFFPRALAKKINACDAYFTPYCGIPSGINISVYSTIHDVIFLDMPDLAGAAGTFIRKRFYLRAVKKSKTVFTVSEFSKSRIQAHLKPRAPIAVVYNGIPAYFEKPLAPPPEKNDTVIFIGNIKRHKGLQTLIPSFQTFRKRLIAEGKTPAELLIVGSKENFRTQDENLSALQDRTAENGITFTGFVADDELHRLLAEARILVQPSLYEGFGIPPLQALHAGTRALISGIPVFKEIYADYPVSFFKAGDADDLAEKLYSEWTANAPVPPFSAKYSYKDTAERILKEILTH